MTALLAPRVAAGSHRRISAAALAAAVLASLVGLAGCSQGKPDVVPSDDDAKPTVTVRVTDNQYDPKTVEIDAGEAVQWVFEGNDSHDVVAGDASFVSELSSSGAYTHVFDRAGEYAYDCSVHPEMTGVVRVSE